MNQKTGYPIDLAQLNQISEGDIEFEIEVLQVYVEDVLQRVEKMQEAIANGDSLQISKEAHHIKGSSSNVGASQMRDLALQIEELDLNQNLGQVPDILDHMRVQIQAVDAFVNQKMAAFSSL